MRVAPDHQNKITAKLLLRLFTGVAAGLLASLLPMILAGAASSTVLIKAIYYDTYLSGEPDEAFQLINISASPVDLTNWTATDFEGTVTLSGTLASGERIWIAREADDFYLEFGFKPDYEYQADTDSTVPNLTLTGSLSLANSGDQLAVHDASSTLVDAIVYEGGATAGTDWSGAAIEPYDQGFFGIEGQILYRKLDQVTGQPVPDTDTAVTGRRLRITTSMARKCNIRGGIWTAISSPTR